MGLRSCAQVRLPSRSEQLDSSAHDAGGGGGGVGACGGAMQVATWFASAQPPGLQPHSVQLRRAGPHSEYVGAHW